MVYANTSTGVSTSSGDVTASGADSTASSLSSSFLMILLKLSPFLDLSRLVVFLASNLTPLSAV